MTTGPVDQPATGSLDVRLAGPFTVLRGGRPLATRDVGSRKARTLLKVLASDPGRLWSAEQLAEVIWADGAPERPAENVATLVSRLRAILGAESISGDRTGWRDRRRGGRRPRRGRPPGRGGAGPPAGRRAGPRGRRGAARPRAPSTGCCCRRSRRRRGWTRRVRMPTRCCSEPGRSVPRQRSAAATPTMAIELAELSAAADPLDEAAVRVLLRAYPLAGEPATAR